jgi:hypothetical protein
MCKLYSITTNQKAVRALFRMINRYVGNLPPMPGVFPKCPAPATRTPGVIELPQNLQRMSVKGSHPPSNSLASCAADTSSCNR